LSKTGTAIAYSRGKDAFIQGIFSSPYALETIKHKEWQRGFDEAFSQHREAYDVQRIQQPDTLKV
jgi:hypothetical protein